MKWDDQAIARLQVMKSSGRTAQEIANHFGVTLAAASAAIRDFCNQTRPRVWTAESARKLEELAEALTPIFTMAQALGMTEAQIRRQLRNTGYSTKPFGKLEYIRKF